MSEYVTQCFETYPKYGEDTLGTKIKTFVIGLEDCDMSEIDYAFRQWLKEKKKMPLPADIAEIALQHRKHTKYTASPRTALPATAGKPFSPKYPWVGKPWQQIKEDGLLPLVEKHLIELTKSRGVDRAKEYLLYLQNGPQNQKFNLDHINPV